jgi:hypothetical protein
MTQRRQQIIDRLARGGSQTEALFAALTAAQLERPVYADGARWNVRQVLAHLVTIEQSMQRLFRNILEGGPGAPEDFDIERFTPPNRDETASGAFQVSTC